MYERALAPEAYMEDNFDIMVRHMDTCIKENQKFMSGYYWVRVKFTDKYIPKDSKGNVQYSIHDYTLNRPMSSLAEFLEFQGFSESAQAEDSSLSYFVEDYRCFDSYEELLVFQMNGYRDLKESKSSLPRKGTSTREMPSSDDDIEASMSGTFGKDL